METSKAVRLTSNEIKKFMNLTFNEWTTNDGIGKGANEFTFFNTMKFYELFSKDSIPSSIKLEKLYTHLTQEYKRRKEQHKITFINSCIESYFNVEFDNQETVKNLADGFEDYVISLKYKQEYDLEIIETH